jgi:dsRNA-specific ribonuclease
MIYGTEDSPVTREVFDELDGQGDSVMDFKVVVYLLQKHNSLINVSLCY